MEEKTTKADRWIDFWSLGIMPIILRPEGCKLNDLQENSISLKQGETIFVPASTENVTFIPESKMEILTSRV